LVVVLENLMNKEIKLELGLEMVKDLEKELELPYLL